MWTMRVTEKCMMNTTIDIRRQSHFKFEAHKSRHGRSEYFIDSGYDLFIIYLFRHVKHVLLDKPMVGTLFVLNRDTKYKSIRKKVDELIQVSFLNKLLTNLLSSTLGLCEPRTWLL